MNQLFESKRFNKFLGFQKIPEGVLLSSKGGIFNKAEPKYKLTFLDETTGEVCQSNDLDRKIWNRNNRFREFTDHYKPLFEKRQINIISMVIYVDQIANVPQFIKNFKCKTLKRRGIRALSHFAINDIGSKGLRAHKHLFIVTEPFDDALYEVIFKRSKQRKYKATPMDKTFGLIAYCMRKDLFVGSNGRSYSRSPIFKSPKKTFYP